VLEEDQTRFDIVFADVAIPRMNWLELGREIRQRYTSLPAVLTSG
jgi:DNA-binding LytR/AlgR family response regulator